MLHGMTGWTQKVETFFKKKIGLDHLKPALLKKSIQDHGSALSGCVSPSSLQDDLIHKNFCFSISLFSVLWSPAMF